MPKAKPDKKQIRPTGYYDVKISAGEKGKSGKGVKKAVAEAIDKQHKSLKKGEKLDCRKRGNKKLKECIERALKKRKEKEARDLKNILLKKGLLEVVYQLLHKYLETIELRVEDNPHYK